jgi:hypothetical protein
VHPSCQTLGVMNPTLYALCQKPILGPILGVSSLCAFPPLLDEAPIDVSSPGTVLSSNFRAPVSKGYFLSVTYTFPTTEDRIKDTIVGSTTSTDPCYGKEAKQFDSYAESVRSSLGKPLRLKVTVRKPNGEVIYSQSLASVCQAGHDLAARKTQVVSLFELPEGELSIDVENIEPRQDLTIMRPTLRVHSGAK